MSSHCNHKVATFRHWGRVHLDPLVLNILSYTVNRGQRKLVSPPTAGKSIQVLARARSLQSLTAFIRPCSVAWLLTYTAVLHAQLDIIAPFSTSHLPMARYTPSRSTTLAGMSRPARVCVPADVNHVFCSFVTCPDPRHWKADMTSSIHESR